MPLFEYECRRCGRRFEALVRGNERATCPECGSRSLERLLSTFNAGTSRSSSVPSCAGSMPCCRRGECNPAACSRAF